MQAPEEKTPALVLGVVKYGESGHVVRTFTPDHGLVPFMVHSLHAKRTGVMRPSMTMPMSALDIVIRAKSKGNLKTMAEVRPLEHWKLIHTDPIRMTLCTFAAEVLGKVVTEEHADPFLFNSTMDWLKSIDSEEASLATAGHEFLLLVCRHLGCFPSVETYKPNAVFDLMDGTFTASAPDHTFWLTGEESEALYLLIHREKVPKKYRQSLLNELLGYLRIHHEPFGTLKSLEVIRDLLS